MKRTALYFLWCFPCRAAAAAHRTSRHHLDRCERQPRQPQSGRGSKITVNGTLESANCGIRMEYGNPDMPREDFVLSDKGGQLPFTITKTFSKPGTYKIEALGRKVGKLTFG